MARREGYLKSVKGGDELFNFLEGNKRYFVVQVSEGETDRPIEVRYECDGKYLLTRTITFNGTYSKDDVVPYFLYEPVKVLDPANLPGRPWRPRWGEWVWARISKKDTWFLARFSSNLSIPGVSKRYKVMLQQGGKMEVREITPFRGELPPGLPGAEERVVEKGDWVWWRGFEGEHRSEKWELGRFVSDYFDSKGKRWFHVRDQFGNNRSACEIEPFRGKLPSGLE